MLSPYTVVSSSLNVTAIKEGVAQAVEVADVAELIGTVGEELWLEVGKMVLVAALHVPLAELPEQLDGKRA